MWFEALGEAEPTSCRGPCRSAHFGPAISGWSVPSPFVNGCVLNGLPLHFEVRVRAAQPSICVALLLHLPPVVLAGKPSPGSTYSPGVFCRRWRASSASAVRAVFVQPARATH